MSDDDTRGSAPPRRPPRRRRRKPQTGARRPPPAKSDQGSEAGGGEASGRERRGRHTRRPGGAAGEGGPPPRERAAEDAPSPRRGRRRGRRQRPEHRDRVGDPAQAAGPPPTAGGDDEPFRAAEAEGRDDTAGPDDASAAERPRPLDFELPDNPAADDPDPVTGDDEQASGDEAGGRVEVAAEERPLPDRLGDVVGVKFTSAGKIYQYASTDTRFERGESVVIESDQGPMIGTIAVATHRRAGAPPKRRALRRPSRGDHRSLERGGERAAQALGVARTVARELDLPIKVFRVEPALSGNKLVVYFSSESRIDFRGFVRELAQQLKAKVEMRQTGVRDEAKLVGGIGSCGQELCCTTWLPAFVPVSIKMAKDQGMVLNPAKVAGQCGRLKCCLVYEQSTYAEMRKGLPKVGKRVVTDGGEGRVVEVDVLHQRVRVSLEGGQFQTYPAAEIQAKFPPQQAGSRKKARDD